MRPLLKSITAIAVMIFLLVLPGILSAQFVITNSNGTPGTVPRADDAISCTDGDLRTIFRLTGSPGGIDPSFSLSLPTGVNYIDGTVTVVNSNLAVAPTIGPNTGTANQPSFQITGTFDAGDFIVISLARIADCDAVPGGGKQDAVAVTPGIGGAVLSNNYDVLAANLSVTADSPVTTSVGSTETVTGVITNGGNGCVSEFEFTVMDAPGVMTNSIVISGMSIMPTSTIGNLSVYTITSAFIGGDGCFDGGENLAFTRDVTIISCDLAGDGYTVRYGCFGAICQTSSFANQQFNLAFTVPNVRYTSGVVVQATDLCRDVIVEHTFTNNGSGAAFDIIYQAGFGASGLIVAGSTGGVRGIPVSGVAINGVPVPFVFGGPNGGGLEVDLSALTADPDVGGLEDLDLDNQFDDLPAGATVTITLTHTVIPDTGCPASRSTGSYKTALLYSDQCDAPIARFIQNAAGSIVDFSGDGRGSIIGPADINDQETIEIEVCGTQRFGGSFFDCPTSELSLVGNLPPGFTLNFAEVNGVMSTDVEFRNDSLFVTSDFVSAREYCYNLNLTFDCSVYLGDPDRDLDFDFFLEFECDADAPCGATRETFSCPIYAPNVHCGDCEIGGLTTQNTLAVRSTTGFENPLTCEDFADPATLTALQLKRAMPCDTVCIQANAIQLDGTSGPTWNNAFFHLEYDPLAGNASNTLSYAGGTVEIFEVATGMRFDCPIPVPQEQNIDNAGSANDKHILDFDLTSCLTVLPGSLLRPGDSVNVNLKVVVEKTGALDNDVPTQLEDISIFHYNLVDTVPTDMVLDTVTCDNYGLELYLHEPTNGGGGGLTNRQVRGCDFYSGFKTFPFSGSEDWYPGEIRPNYKLDSIVIAFTSRDVLDFSSVELRAEGNPADGYGAQTYIPLALGTPDRIAEGTTERRYIWVNDGTWPIGDMNGRFNSQGGYSLLADFFPSCESIDGRLSMGFYAQRYGYSQDTDCYERATNIGTVNVDHNLPSTTIQNQTGTVEASNDTVRWEVQIQNIVNVNGGFVFLGFEDVATGNIDVIGLRDIAADTIIPLLPYVDGDWAVVNPAFPAQMALDYEVTAVLTGCATDAVRAITGFACDGPPDDPTDYPCDFDEVLLDVVPLLSRVQIRLDQAQGPFDLCTVIRDTIVITSAERAFIDEALLCIPLPPGFMEDDALVEITYPRLTGPEEVISTTLSGDTLYVELMDHSLIGETGVPGTDNAPLQEEREVSVQVSWITDCDFRGGSTYTPVILANRPCGDPAIGNGSNTTSDGININGALPSSVTAFSPEVTPDIIQGCDDVMISIQTSVTLGETADRDSIQIEFPLGLIYEPGSFVCTANNAADQPSCPQFVRVDVALDGSQTLIISIAPNVNAPVTYTFDFDAMAVAGGICNDEGILNIISTSTNSGIQCATDPNGVCDNFTIITGQATDTIRFLKPVVSLTEFMACTENGEYRIDGMITVDTLPINAGESVTFEFFCPDDPNTVVGTFVVDGPIAQATPTAISTTIPASCAGQELIARVTAIGDNCVCETVETTFDILEEVLVDAGADGSVCGNKVFDLAVSGASITGGVTEGVWTTSGDGLFLDDLGLPATIFTEVAGYEPGATDRTSGSVTLTLTSDQPGMCMPVSDVLILTVLNVDCGSLFWDGSND